MPSKGTPMIGVRIPPILRAHIELVIEHRNDNSTEEPWTLSAFVAIALREKIEKMARSRGRQLDPCIGDILRKLPAMQNREPTLFDAQE